MSIDPPSSTPNSGEPPSNSSTPGAGATSTQKTGQPREARFARLLTIIAVVIAITSVVLPYYTDFAWFRSVDYLNVFGTVLGARVVMGLISGVIMGLILWLAFVMAFRGRPAADPLADLWSPEERLSQGASPLSIHRTEIRKRLRSGMVIAPLVGFAMGALIGQSQWQNGLMFLNRRPFGVTDPQFNLDLGFYAFSLPLLQFVTSLLSSTLLMAFALNGFVNYLLGGITTGDPRARRKAQFSDSARRQLATIAGLWMLTMAVSFWLGRYSLLNNRHGTFTGASYTDVNAHLPAQIVLLVISLFVAALFFFTIVMRDLRIPALAVALMVGSYLVVGVAWPAILEQFSVNPNRAEKEREYIARNIEATRFAYGLTDDKITYDTEWAKPEGTTRNGERRQRDSVGRDAATISNIRLLDPEVISPTFTQQQQLRNFYGFPDKLAIDRYQVDGQIRSFVVAARELNPNTLAGNQTDWINRHTVYTHGNGFIAAPARKIDEVARDVGSARGGYPVYTVADLQSLETGRQGGELKLDLKQPRIYFGPVIASSRQGSDDYAIVGTKSAEPLEYDTDTRNYSYTGTGGVDINNYFNRVMFSAHFRSMNMLLTDRIGEGSRIVFDRDPRERVRKVAPWLTTDSKTYPVVIDGRIKWLVDGYTTLADLPYAQRMSLTEATADATNPDGVDTAQIFTDRVSYIRNSVKAVVDAYDGSVELYAFDENDPVLATWRDAFPGVVKDRSEMSKAIESHVRYPEDIFKVQRELIAKYHVSDPGVFFQSDAFWSVPSDPTAPTNRQDLAQPPYYVMAADPETNQAAFQLITPFRGLRRQFLAAHMTVAADAKNYGRIYVRVLPTGTQTQGPTQAQDTMMSSDEIARERTLLQGTNDLTNGNLLTLPVGDGQILYVEPLYSQRKGQESAFPKLLRVLVSYNGQVGYAPTVAEALAQVGIDASAVTRVQEIDGSVVRPKAGQSGASSRPSTQGSAAAQSDSNRGAVGTGAVSAGSPEAAVRAAMDKVKRARTSGSFEEFGRALDELDAAVARLQQAQGQ